jgi:hypothetical protein
MRAAGSNVACPAQASLGAGTPTRTLRRPRGRPPAPAAAGRRQRQRARPCKHRPRRCIRAPGASAAARAQRRPAPRSPRPPAGTCRGALQEQLPVSDRPCLRGAPPHRQCHSRRQLCSSSGSSKPAPQAHLSSARLCSRLSGASAARPRPAAPLPDRSSWRSPVSAARGSRPPGPWPTWQAQRVSRDRAQCRVGSAARGEGGQAAGGSRAASGICRRRAPCRARPRSSSAPAAAAGGAPLCRRGQGG